MSGLGPFLSILIKLSKVAHPIPPPGISFVVKTSWLSNLLLKIVLEILTLVLSCLHRRYAFNRVRGVQSERIIIHSFPLAAERESLNSVVW
jgi:hypothetical protein